MYWFSILLIAIAANLDNLGISVSYGLKSKKISLPYNLIIAFISGVCSFLSLSAGSFLSGYFSSSIANFVGGSLIICLGVYFLCSSESTPCKSKSFSNQDEIISFKESGILGFILALNCLTIGLGAGITALPPISTSIAIGIFSFLSILIGMKIGIQIGNSPIGRSSNLISGFLLIVIGVYEIFL